MTPARSLGHRVVWGAIAVVVATIVPTVRAECVPEKMMVAVVRIAPPGTPEDSPDARVTQLYRVGRLYGRLETSSTSGSTQMLVVSAPDAWLWISGAKKGVRTKLPSGVFRAPLYAFARDSSLVSSVEFGCEREQLLRFPTASTSTIVIASQEYEMIEATDGKYRVGLVFDPAKQTPVSFLVSHDEKLVMFMRYMAYGTALEPDMSLFEAPKGVKFKESRTSK